MKQVFIVSRTDDWHSNSSVLGVATSKKKAIKLIKLQAKKEGIKLTEDNKLGLKNSGQTFSSSFDGEFNIEEVDLNKLK